MFFIMHNLISIGVFVIFGVVIFRLVFQWNRNNHSPRLTVAATVVAKRSSTSHHHHGGDTMHTSHSTSYYATFQFETGDRLELHIPSTQFGYLVEGDRGQLSFQGTRFLGFERT